MHYVRRKPRAFGRNAQIEGEMGAASWSRISPAWTARSSPLSAPGGFIAYSFVIFSYGMFRRSGAEGAILHWLPIWWGSLRAAQGLGYFTREQFTRRQPQRRRFLTGNAANAVHHGFFVEMNQYIEHYGYFAVALGILLEDFGLPAPGETLLITGSIGASTGALNIYLLLPIAWIGAVIGDNIGYAIGHFGGHRLMMRYGGRIGIAEDSVKQVEAFFERYGGWVIVFARFVVILRQFNGIVAGTLGMHWLHFLALNALGAALWVSFWGILSYWLGKGVLVYVHELYEVTPPLGVLVVVFLALGAGYLWWRFTRKRRS